MAMKTRAATLVTAALLLGGCASASGNSPIAWPTPSPGDTEGQIMSVTGAGFALCSISDLESSDGSTLYIVNVCGSVAKARAVLEAQYPQLAKVTELHAYQPDDGGRHTSEELVMQFWIGRTTGPGFTVTSSQILGDGTIDVGVDGDLKAAKAVLDREFPGRTKVHAQTGDTAL